MLASHRLPTSRVIRLNHARKFSLLSTHTSFPATMYRFQLHRNATLYDASQEETRHRKDGIKVSEDGLVHAMISKSSPCKQTPFFCFNEKRYVVLKYSLCPRLQRAHLHAQFPSYATNSAIWFLTLPRRCRWRQTYAWSYCDLYPERYDYSPLQIKVKEQAHHFRYYYSTRAGFMERRPFALFLTAFKAHRSWK